MTRPTQDDIDVRTVGPARIVDSTAKTRTRITSIPALAKKMSSGTPLALEHGDDNAIETGPYLSSALTRAGAGVAHDRHVVSNCSRGSLRRER